MAYKQVLAAVDLTEEADEVLTAASDIAKRHDADLAVVTVVRPLSRVYGGIDMAPIAAGSIAFETEAVDQAKAQLTTLAGEYGVAPGAVHVTLGHPAGEIKDLAESTETDLIVIGTHGRHGLGLLLGSTANAVLHGVPCDVLAVRITAEA